MIEPVAWALYWDKVDLCRVTTSAVDKDAWLKQVESGLDSVPTAFVVPLYAIPPGFAIVPVEPTEAMIEKVVNERLDCLISGKEHTFVDCYKAMLTAAAKVEQSAPRLAERSAEITSAQWDSACGGLGTKAY